MEEEIKSLIKVTTYVVISMTYARFISSKVKPGKVRLIFLLPLFLFLPSLPFYFKTINLRGSSAFFLTWLATFKLFLLSYGHGPLSPSLSLLTFIAISSLPVKTKPLSKKYEKSSNTLIPFIIKLMMYAFLTSLYQYKSQLNQWVILIILCLSIYLALEMLFALTAFVASNFFNLVIEPQVDAPFKSSSLQDFWGRRWNLMVTNILRATVYNPIKSRFGSTIGVIAAFVVSGFMHEVIFYYLTYEKPSGEVSMFFLLHGFCLIMEVKLNKKGLYLNVLMGVVLTLGFVMVTAFWLFLPPLVRARADEKGFQEFMDVMRIAQNGSRQTLAWLKIW